LLALPDREQRRPLPLFGKSTLHRAALVKGIVPGISLFQQVRSVTPKRSVREPLFYLDPSNLHLQFTPSGKPLLIFRKGPQR
jgi:hypothetical protein